MGPLEGVRVIEMAGIGPAPFCAMMLADMGAQVIRIDRKGVPDTLITLSVLKRGRRSAALDLKKPAGAAAVLRLVERADALIEGFRPGVMERLGLGPEVCLERNPRLVYGRMTGWGQDGPLAPAPGHDLNYIALTGVLFAIGDAARPVPPLNLVGDFGGGAMYLAFGITCGPSSTATCSNGSGSTIRTSRINGTVLAGPDSAKSSPLSLRRAPARSGARYWRGRTPVLLRSSIWKRRRATRTTEPAEPSCRSRGLSSPVPRRAFPARPPK